MDVLVSPMEFETLRTLLYRETGIALGDDKRELMGGRLRARLAALGLSNLAQYARRIREDRQELTQFINAMTTNKTDFLRERTHFDALAREVLPAFREPRPFLAWSAACSTGEEPYTLGMTLAEFARTCPGFDFRILATDIDTHVLEKAMAGTFETRAMEPVSPSLRSAYFEKGRGENEGLWRVRSGLREKYKFRSFNLLTGVGLTQSIQFDVVFLRNVLIYFDLKSTSRVIANVLTRLKPGGLLYIGHSESLREHGKELAFVGDATYRKL